MALFVMIFRKMVKNKWLELSLLLGLVLSVALVSSMPIYTDAILQRMLVKDLELSQNDSGQFPGAFLGSSYMSDLDAAKRLKYTDQVDKFMVEKALPSFGIPAHFFVIERGTQYLKLTPDEGTQIDPKVNRIAQVSAMKGIEEHIELIDGRLPSNEPVDGVYEVMVPDGGLSTLKMVLGNVFVIQDKAVLEPVKIKPVGVFTRKSEYDTFWYNTTFSSYKQSIFVPFDLYEKDFRIGGKLPHVSNFWYMSLDYTQLDLTTMQSFFDTNRWVNTVLKNRFFNYAVKAPALKTMEKYAERETKLRILLWSLNIPVIIMLGFYLFMVSNLITDRQKTEIAVLRSRGASRLQIICSYVIEGILLGVIAFIAGPMLGMLLTKMLGASNGFLEFVQRASLKVRVGEQAYQYALIAVVSSVIMTLIPAFLATRVSIVGHKQQMSRLKKTSFFHKFFIDIILIGVSVYGLRSFHTRMNDLQKLGLDTTDMNIDPLLFLVPALFIIGSGLFILRIYPFFVRFVYWVGRKWWPPSLYSTLIQVGRSTSHYQFLMVFLIITLSTGLFSASAARTININTQEKILYKNGADLTLNIRWENDAPPPAMAGPGGPQPAAEGPPKKVQYTEAPYEPLTKLPGVEQTAKVFIKENADYSAGNNSGSTKLMGIDTDDFGRTVWMKDGLLPHHFYDYLNLLSTNPTAVLISRSIAEQTGAKEGDPIQVGWSEAGTRSFVIYGIIDFFPGFNPNPKGSGEKSNNADKPKLIVGHREYISRALALEPYEVWIKLKKDALVQPLYDELAAQKIPVTGLTNTREQLKAAKNDPFQMSINGVMTLGFMISIAICFFGFLLYWILSLSGRTLQLGMLRAMGISFPQLVGMLIAEQILTSGAAIAIGVLCGNLASRLFVPMFQISFNPAAQVPPFEVINDSLDSIRLYSIVAFMVTLGLIILSVLLSRIKIHQAIKLGED